MWMKVEEFKNICSDGRWKVEFFSGELEIKIDSIYPVRPISELVTESKDTLDPQESPNKMFNYIGLENIESLTGDVIGFSPKKGMEIKSRSKIFSSGDVLYGRLRPYLNKVFIARDNFDIGICSGEFFVLKINKSKIRPIILRYILASSFVVGHLAKFQSGAALPRVTLRDLLQMKIPVPPINDQRRLESALIAFEDHRRTIRKKVEKMPLECMELLMGYLHEGCPPEISLPM